MSTGGRRTSTLLLCCTWFAVGVVAGVTFTQTVPDEKPAERIPEVTPATTDEPQEDEPQARNRYFDKRTGRELLLTPAGEWYDRETREFIPNADVETRTEGKL